MSAPRPAVAAKAAAAGLAGAAALHAACALGVPFGWFKDDALHTLLARHLGHGSYPAVDPLPGFPLILTLPVALLSPHWAWLKLVPLAFAVLLVWCAWRLGRLLYTGPRAYAPAVLTAFTPVLAMQSGVVMPDLPCAALSLWSVERLASAAPYWQAALVAGLAALCRVQGAVAAMALVLALLLARRIKDAVRAAALSLGPLAAWSLYSAWRFGSASPLWDSFLARWSEDAAAGERSGRLLAVIADFGRGMLLPNAPDTLARVFGFLVLGAAVRSAWSLRDRREPWVRALLLGVAGLLALQILWGVPDPRYAVPLAAGAWLLITAVLPPIVIPVLAVGLAVFPVQMAVSLGIADPVAWPETTSWLKARAQADDRVESLVHAPLTLLAGAAAVEPAVGAATRDGWVASLISGQITLVHLDGSQERWDTAAPGARAAFAGRPDWAATSSWFELVFESRRENSRIYRLRHPAPARFLAAARLYAEGVAAARAQDENAARALLVKAATLEPGLAVAWAGLATMEKDPRRRADLAAKARRADPTLPDRLLPKGA